jgi:hypothetical protein|nr:MAG TPA: hypothetical protein [Caudoviricetes sp.]
MSNTQDNVIELETVIEDDSPIISFNVPKIKRLAKKALPYVIAGTVTVATTLVAMMLSPNDSDDNESSDETLPEFVEFDTVETPVVEETTED